MNRKILIIIEIIIIFLGASINQSVAFSFNEKSTLPISDKIVIIVDDEGDGDYTSINNAVKNALPGYTIKVYSGTYNEKEIYIVQPGLTLQGIPYELGNGNDTGKPVVTSTLNSFNYIFSMRGNDITITGFVIIDLSEPHISYPIRILGDGCKFSYNNVFGGWMTICIGEDLDHQNQYSSNTCVIGNTIENTTIGLCYNGKYGNISRNSFRMCRYRAIEVGFQSTSNYISYNNICNCSKGIEYYSGSDSIISNNVISANIGIDLSVSDEKNIKLMMNQLHQCGTGVYLIFDQKPIKVHKNNFINNNIDIRFLGYFDLNYNYFLNPIFDENYYDSWKEYGLKWIQGGMIFIWLPIPWFLADFNPSKEPYDIKFEV
jgi:hypothetical protein